MNNFLLRGDLNQMGKQRVFLNSHGIKTTQVDVYPSVEEKDIGRALQLILTEKIEGWWNYRNAYILYSVCTEEEFRNHL